MAFSVVPPVHVRKKQHICHVWVSYDSAAGDDTSLCAVSCPLLLPSTSLCAWCTVRPNKLKHCSLEQRKVSCRAMQGSCPPKTPNHPKGFSKALLKARWRRGMVSCCKLLGVGICSRRCPHRSGHDVSVSLHQTNVIHCCATFFLKFMSLFIIYQYNDQR